MTHSNVTHDFIHMCDMTHHMDRSCHKCEWILHSFFLLLGGETPTCSITSPRTLPCILQCVLQGVAVCIAACCSVLEKLSRGYCSVRCSACCSVLRCALQRVAVCWRNSRMDSFPTEMSVKRHLLVCVPWLVLMCHDSSTLMKAHVHVMITHPR